MGQINHNRACLEKDNFAEKRGMRFRSRATLFFCMFLLPVSGCAPKIGNAPTKNPARIIPGRTSATELFAEYGMPTHSYQSESRPQAEVHQFQDSVREAYQVENGKVVAQFRDPEPKEATLQYWRHLWRGKQTSYEELPGSQNPHGQAQYSFRNKTDHIAVIYDSARDRVVRVVRYGE
jgi:hypothetical protein